MSKEKTDNTAISPEAAVSPERLEELTEGALESVSGGSHWGHSKELTRSIKELTRSIGRIGISHSGPFRGGHGK